MSDYGKKGGTSANAGKKAITYLVDVPGHGTVNKRVFFDCGDAPTATGFKHNGKAIVAVWPGEPSWEGDFGRLVARKSA